MKTFIARYLQPQLEHKALMKKIYKSIQQYGNKQKPKKYIYLCMLWLWTIQESIMHNIWLPLVPSLQRVHSIPTLESSLLLFHPRFNHYASFFFPITLYLIVVTRKKFHTNSKAKQNKFHSFPHQILLWKQHNFMR